MELQCLMTWESVQNLHIAVSQVEHKCEVHKNYRKNIALYFVHQLSN